MGNLQPSVLINYVLLKNNNAGYPPQVANRSPQSLVVTYIRTDGPTDRQTKLFIESLIHD